MSKFIGLDTETVIRDGVHRFYSFQMYSNDFTYNKQNIDFFSTKEIDFERFLTEKFNRAWFITFNLAFDGIVIARILKDKSYSVKAVVAGCRFIRLTIRRGELKWIICDLRNILPIGSLDDVGKALKIPKLDKPDYLGLRAPITLKEKTYFRKYAMRDAEICYKAARMIRDEFKTFRTTCAGLAIRVFKRDFCHIRKFANYQDTLLLKMRASYHGGRTECFIRGTNLETIRSYDINSLYPYVMAKREYPNVLERYKNKRSVNLDYEGIAHVKVSCTHPFPPICTKKLCSDGIEKLVFPTGTITAWFTYPELRALEEFGEGKIELVHEAFEWQNTFNPFKEYVEHFYAKKETATKHSDSRRQFYKIMLNSLYGKFGEHGQTRFLEFDGAEIISENVAPSKRSWYHSVPLASYITAYARLENWQYLKTVDSNKMYYTDTDSFDTSADFSMYVGNALGKLKLEGTAKMGDAVFIRSKFYLFNNDITMKGFAIRDSMEMLKTAIYNGDFQRQEHRILKVLEARRIEKEALSDVYVYKNFSVESDEKRDYLKKLTSKELLTDFSLSKPVDLRL